LKLGLINYSNSYPFVLDLQKEKFPGVELIQDIPSQLNAKLSRGDLDVSSISAFEYLRHHQQYALMPKWCINSKGAVKSVLLFSKVPMKDLSGASIQLTTHSATSLHLLKVLMAMKGISVSNWIQGDNPNCECDGMLLIGDPALCVDSECFPFVLDLAQAWASETGFPAVFAVKAVRLDRLERVRPFLPKLIQRLEKTNDVLTKEGVGRFLPELKRHFPDIKLDFPSYFDCLDFDFSEDCFNGLRLYADACYKYGFLQTSPPIKPISL
jgi:chorismate dehydratase